MSKPYRGSLVEMIRHPLFGIKSVIEVMNTWIEEWGRGDREGFKLVRYEDLLKDPAGEFRRVLAFLGFDEIDEKAFSHSLEFASFDNMKRMEGAGEFRAGILKPGDPQDPESFKMRRGKREGYKDYLATEDILYLNQAMARLDQRYGYGISE